MNRVHVLVTVMCYPLQGNHSRLGTWLRGPSAKEPTVQRVNSWAVSVLFLFNLS